MTAIGDGPNGVPDEAGVRLIATSLSAIGPRESRHERITAKGSVVYEDDWRVDFRADDGEVRVFMREVWDVELAPTR